jgi:hypothetical protein
MKVTKNLKPQKRSIRDFFSPATPSSKESPLGTQQLPGTRHEFDKTLKRAAGPTLAESRARASPVAISRTSSEAPNNTPPATHADRSSVPPASTTNTENLPPPTSQTSANSGVSKRVVSSNGEQVVLNSDSDNDSLPELDWGEPVPAWKPATPATRPKRTFQDEGDEGDDELRKPQKKTKSKESDLLAQTVQEHAETERLIREHKAALESELEDSAPAFVFNEDALGQVVQDEHDPDKAHRLYLAMQRTNATQTEYVFHFSQDMSDSSVVQSRFPSHSLPKHRWTSNFQGDDDASSRSSNANSPKTLPTEIRLS